MAVPASHRREAAFFDVDGTLVDSTIVHYYAYFRRKDMSRLAGAMWSAMFLGKCLGYLVLDKINRSRFNARFYRSYAGLPAGEIRAHARPCYDAVIKPRHYPEGFACVAEHASAGRMVVLVTGSIDFIMDPLAVELKADALLAASLVEENNHFTGNLNGPPIGDAEKARRIERFAAEHGIDLARSYAYGDSIADLPMLETVGHPHAVNPDRALKAKATARGWPVLSWKRSTVNHR